jgi:16S rRNA (uracil1498-N3)-methyltransferase
MRSSRRLLGALRAPALLRAPLRQKPLLSRKLSSKAADPLNSSLSSSSSLPSTRLFLPDGAAGARPAVGASVKLDKASAHHLRVLRLKDGELVTLVCDGRVLTAEYLPGAGGSCRVVAVASAAPVRGVHLALFQALGKRDKFETVVDQLTQLGAAEIVPLSTERTVVQLDSDRASTRLERWRLAAKAAAEQSRRDTLPLLRPLTAWNAAVDDATASFDCTVVCAEHGGASRRPLAEVVRPLRKASAAGGAPAAAVPRVAVFVGPEGGLSEAEVAYAAKRGAVPVTLGPRILRTELAPVAACAIVLNELGALQ